MASTKYNFIGDVCCRVDGTNNPSDCQVSSTCMFGINTDNLLLMVHGYGVLTMMYPNPCIIVTIQDSKKCTRSG